VVRLIGAGLDPAEIDVPLEAAPGTYLFQVRSGESNLTLPFTVIASADAGLGDDTKGEELQKQEKVD